MSLFETIEKDYVQAYKAKDAVRLTVLRLLKTAVKNRLVDLCRPGGTLDDAEMLDLIIKEGKQRQDSIEQYTSAGRQDGRRARCRPCAPWSAAGRAGGPRRWGRA